MTSLEYADLLERLRLDLQLDAKTDIVRGTILEALRPEDIDGGQSTLIWTPGGVRLSDTKVIAHHLGVSPDVVLPGAIGTTNVYVAPTVITATHITFQGNTIDGSFPAALTTRSFTWLAIKGVP